MSCRGGLFFNKNKKFERIKKRLDNLFIMGVNRRDNEQGRKDFSQRGAAGGRHAPGQEKFTRS
jgi:hypothetical protein